MTTATASTIAKPSQKESALGKYPHIFSLGKKEKVQKVKFKKIYSGNYPKKDDFVNFGQKTLGP